jgi:cell division transport system permease protein
VTAVDYGEQAIERLSAIVRAVRVAGAFAFALIVIATVLIVSATLQLAIYARRQEIEIQKLVGATDRFVKAPFLLEGLLQGLLGATVALAGLWGFSRYISPRLSELFTFLWLPGSGTELLAPALALELWTAGAMLGLLGSFLAVSRFSRV